MQIICNDVRVTNLISHFDVTCALCYLRNSENDLLSRLGFLYKNHSLGSPCRSRKGTAKKV